MLKIFTRVKKTYPFVTAVVAAGGTGARMGENKLLIELDNIPVLAHTLLALENSDMVKEIIVSAHPDFLVEYAQISRFYGVQKLRAVIVGGDTRTKSVLRGVLEAGKETKFVLVHDAARPFVKPEDIDTVCQKAFDTGAATAAIHVRDTFKIVSGDKVTGTVPRENLVQVQTPQVFDIELLKGALSNAVEKNMEVTDDCAAVEALGYAPFVVFTAEDNIKLTTPTDLVFADGILRSRE